MTMRGDAHHGEDHAVDEGDDHQVVPGRERLRQVVEQDEVRRPGELQQIRLGDRLGGNEENEDEGHHEEDRGDHDGRDPDDQAAVLRLRRLSELVVVPVVAVVVMVAIRIHLLD